MSSLQTYLEDFGSSTPHHAGSTVTDDALESERLEAFDKGYRAGWDDAIKAKAEDSDALSEGLSQTLQDLSFTYHDVHAQVFSNLGPLFDQILQKILPTLAKETLGAHITDQLSGLAREIGTASVQVAVCAADVEKVTKLVDEASCTMPVTVIGSDSLQDGQAELQFGQREISIDLAHVASQITEAVQAVLNDSPERRAHG
ncbi:hypothetical protein [Marivita hallyeonensis]|uniref:Flagellar assembly protein FliH n=1 Tax=Marivita hallyeonensis TaxID=996342 RepID=A0A1M5XTV1_9RHOB|nr:hypothetical protein [Marivita hallyeonensis]SHI03227.1 flagellar assembly protein FliH [Marivita hallyeonensis]